MSSTPTTPAWQRVLASGKDLLPWLMLAYQMVYGLGVRTSTSDHLLQQQQEDHVAIQDLRKNVSDINERQASMTAKLDMLISASFRNGAKP